MPDTSKLHAILEALRLSFPQFEDDADITPDAIRKLGREYEKLVMDPGPSEIQFSDQDGNTRKIVFESGDSDVGIADGWTIPEDADWEARTVDAKTPQKETVERLIKAARNCITPLEFAREHIDPLFRQKVQANIDGINLATAAAEHELA